MAGAVAWLVSPACRLTGVVVGANDGQLSILQMQTVKTRDLGNDAKDPSAAGAAIAEIAATADLAGSEA